MKKLLKSQWVLVLGLLGFASGIIFWALTMQNRLNLDPDVPSRLLVLSLLLLLAIAVVRRASTLEQRVAEQWFLALPDYSYAAYLLLRGDFQILGASDLAKHWLPGEEFSAGGFTP